MRIVLILFLSALYSAPALAGEPILEIDANGDHVWSRGVPKEEINIARALLKEGNALYRQGLLLLAQPKFEEAVKHWKAPGIQYMLGVAMKNNGQLVEAYETLVDSMKYGGYGEEQEDITKYNQANSFKLGLEKQLARMRVKCDVPDATVEMDGRVLFTGPGSYEGMAMPGPHSVSAKKTGYLNHDISRSYAAGSVNDLDVNLLTLEEATEYHRRWPGSKAPWLTVGASAAVGAAGGLLMYLGHSQIRSYENGIGTQCGPDGCNPHENGLSTKRSHGKIMQKIGVGASIAGGAGLITGAVLVYLNRQRPEIKKNPYETSSTEKQVNFAPTISPGTYGITAALNF